MLGNCWVWLLFLDSGFVSTSTHSFTNSATNHMCQLHLTHHTPSKTLPSRVNHSSLINPTGVIHSFKINYIIKVMFCQNMSTVFENDWMASQHHSRCLSEIHYGSFVSSKKSFLTLILMKLMFKSPKTSTFLFLLFFIRDLSLVCL